MVVLLSDNLQFDSHISNICKKAASTLGFLKRNLNHSLLQCPKTAYLNYLALVRSTLEYSIVWDPFRQNNIDSIVQRCFITGNYTSCEHVSDVVLPYTAYFHCVFLSIP